MQPLLVLIALDEFFEIALQMLQVLVVVGVDLFPLQRLDEALTTGIVVRLAGRLMLGTIPCSFRIPTYSAEAYWIPRSEWCTKPGCDFRLAIAISSASVVSRLAGVLQPITLREKPSKTSAK